ncbi:hypothetical protein ANCCEY_12741 [Ancylostoma ceylanicum]|uniref:Uncharacterized protein n=1 Tax=Ancylostoma ceylanicum TaxID=53326 RepID=A0A0D6L908_9BILA|nr:hypothetical protein ANCCEY_12741 [Ancylostoma ceylanicum]
MHTSPHLQKFVQDSSGCEQKVVLSGSSRAETGAVSYGTCLRGLYQKDGSPRLLMGPARPNGVKAGAFLWKLGDSRGETGVGDSCEREIDATDPLHPSTNELSGAKLLLRRAVKEVSPDVQPTVPGQVLRNHKVIRTTHGPKRGRSSEPRLGTAASQNTFVIETERRKPLVLPVGLADGAVEYKKAQEALQKAKEEEAKRLQREQAEREAAEAKERERLRTYRPHASAKKPPTMKKEMAASGESLSSQESNKTPGGKRSPLRKKTPAPGDNFSTTVTSATPVNEAPEPQTFEFEDESQLDYMAVFGARPKIARTPDHIVNRTAYYQ